MMSTKRIRRLARTIRTSPVRRSGNRPPDSLPGLVEQRRHDEGKPEPGVDIGPFRFTYGIALCFIVLIAFWFRFVNLDWDNGLYLHPDERFLAQVASGIKWPNGLQNYFDSTNSPLNPFNAGFTSYVYGTFPIFLDRFVGSLTGHTIYGNISIPGRSLSALEDLAALLFAAWAARMLFGRAVSLLTATFFAFSVLNIQAAHFMTTDSASTLFAIAAFALAIKSGKSGRIGWFILAGMAVGMAAASKPNLLLATGFLGLPALEMVRVHGWDALLPASFRPWSKRHFDRGRLPVVLSTIAGLIAAALTFRIFMPYAFFGPHIWDFQLDPRWTATLDYWRKAQAGIIDMPPGIQWADRTPYLFLLKNFVLWGAGIGFGLTSLAGFLVMGVQIIRVRRWPSWYVLGLLGWIAFHLVFYGGAFVQVMRYLLPAYPFLFITASWLLVRIWRWAQSGSFAIPRLPKWVHPGYLLPVLVVGFTIFYAAAFTNSVYLHSHTRIEASEWMYANIPAGSTVSNEYWDDALPLRLPGHDPGMFYGVQFDNYGSDIPSKIPELVGNLDRVDYYITSSNRLYGSIPRMPDRYPMMTAFYEALFNGDLGFDLIKTFDNPPELFGITLDDANADESFTVYDHPKVMIFKKTDRWSANAAWVYLSNALGDGGINLKPIDVTPDQMMLSPDELSDYRTAGTWSSIFHPGSLLNSWPALWWYLLLQAMALPALPLLWRLLPGLPDRGYALAKLIGLLGTAWLVWVLASLHLVRFSAGSVVWCWLAMCLIGIAAVNIHWQAFIDSLIQRWRWIVCTEAIFLTGFLFSLWLRWQNPDLWHPARGGEKPMDFAFFNAIIKSPWFPPYDPWFAGGAMHYYYWGFVPWAMITKVTGIVPEVAYNLAIPSLFALLLVLVWNAAAIVISRLRAATSDPVRGWQTLGFAVLAPLFVGFLGNLDMAKRIGSGGFGYPAAPGWIDALGGTGHVLFGIWNALTAGRALPFDAYWPSTRVIPGTINEFPYFSFLYADLHAHLMSMPIVAGSLVIALAIGGLAPTAEPGRMPGLLFTLGGWRRVIPLALLAGFASGVLVASNTWDLPPALAMIGVAALIASGTSTGWRMPWITLRDCAIFGGIVYLTGQILLRPYLSRYGSLPSTLDSAGETTTLPDYLTIHGLLLFAIGGMLLAELWTLGRALRPYGGSGWLTIVLMTVVGVSGLAVALATNLALVLIVLLIAAVGLCALNRHLSAAHLLTFAMIGLALGLTLFPEQYRLANDVGRMNTVFKFYLHAWILFGVAAAVSVAYVFTRPAPASWTAPEADFEISPVAPERAWGTWLVSRCWLAGLAVLILASALYPILATTPRLQDRFNDLPPTLNGFAFMQQAEQTEAGDNLPAVRFPLADDAAAIEWLREHVSGTPVILEAVQPQYHWGSRVSIQTGLPTVLGWEWHEIQQRPGYESWIQQRKADIATIYSAPGSFSSITPLLESYDVRLIYVGDLERALYPAEGLAKFDAAAAAGQLTIVYQSDSTVIYAWPPETGTP